VTLLIGMTGPIGCGKSTVAGWLAEAGVVVIDADVVAREVTEPGSVLDQIVATFGQSVRRPDGSLDRAALAAIVFADPERLQALEAIVHPAVRPRILSAVTAARERAAPAVAIEAIKLVEGGLAELCDEVWLVTCDPKAQQERLRDRGGRPDDAARRIAAQGDLESRLRSHATRVLDTSGSMADAKAAVDAAWDEIVPG